MKKVFIYYKKNCADNVYEWDLTDDEELVNSIDSSYRLATIEDLYEYLCSDGYIFEGKIQVEEGIVQWEDKTYINEFGEVEKYGEYELIVK